MKKPMREGTQNSGWCNTCFLIAGMVTIFRTISECETGKITHKVCSKRVKNLIECLVIVVSKPESHH